MKKVAIAIIGSILLMSPVAGCSSSQEEKQSYPIDPRDKRRADRGKISGEGGIKLFNKKGKSSTSNFNGIGVNNVLWRAALDAVSFIPLESADPFGGVIITDWHKDKKTPNERYKLNVFILDSELRAGALKVSVFKQKKADGEWQDTDTPKAMVTEIENKILTKARQKRIDLMTK